MRPYSATTVAGALTCQRTVAENGPAVTPETDTASEGLVAARAAPPSDATAPRISSSPRALPASRAIGYRVRTPASGRSAAAATRSRGRRATPTVARTGSIRPDGARRPG